MQDTRITIGLPGGPQAASGDVTRIQLFAEILTKGPLSRTELAGQTGLSQSTVTKVVNPLIEAGYVVEGAAHSAGLGRPRRLLQVAAERHAAIGVKIAPDTVTAVLTDLQARVLGRRSRALAGRHAPADALTAAAAAVWDLLADDAQVRERLLGIGVGVGGHVDQREGRVVHSGLLGWDGVDVAGPLSAATGVPVRVDNDVNTLVIAERWFGQGRDMRSFALVTIGPGIGCGLLLDGRVFTGASGLAGELGHIPVKPDGPRCTCGNRGCLETVAGDDAVLRAVAADGGPRCADILGAVRIARAGDAHAVAAFEEMGEALGRGLATLGNLLNPARIVLTGERASAFDLFGPACERAWRAHAFSSSAADCELVVDETDDELWARGAASLVIREVVDASLA